MDSTGITMRNLIFVFVLIFLCEQSSGDVQETCTGHNFSAQCGREEIILMERAAFGRMKLGKCIRTEFGHLGCQQDVISKFDALCSGKNSCTMQRIIKQDFGIVSSHNGCPGELELYLETDYTCVRGVDVRSICSRPGKALQIENKPSYLTSDQITASSCLINPQSRSIVMSMTASLGQQINVTLVDLHAASASSQQRQGGCLDYGQIIESKTRQQKRICGGGHQRERWLMTSNSNLVEARFPQNMQGRFMLRLQAIGCADLSTPNGGWIKRVGDSISVGCFTSKQTWHLTCKSNRWSGVIGNCTAEYPRLAKVEQIDDQHAALGTEVWVSLIIACCIVVAVASTTFIIVCWRRRMLKSEIAKMKTNPAQFMTIKNSGGGKKKDDSGSEYMFPVFRPKSTLDETEDAVYDFCFSSGQQQSAGPNNVMTSSVTLPYKANTVTRQLSHPSNAQSSGSPIYKTLVFVKP
ncbi:hypothetical protein CAPTEDRAFT_197657 [Capitella teleta]|uniref:SUEL-type lectin domain-containing protein n=1 Tax=Capitella teleta TaxID=283909 RepID=R7VHG2_CAPTE|nr:hypothetical protein CAPTEDRAFT_197657 [Capitella teleta]|eukprot:ELU18017.1 hypothetical protein CAPTEDRAFT_197657 [Capitella teleta]